MNSDTTPTASIGKETPDWFRQWFNQDYLELYRHRNKADADKQISLIVKTLQLTPAVKTSSGKLRILDVGCGYGRHVQSLRSQGLEATGLDLSPTLIAVGKKKFPNLPIVVRDMRTLGKAPECDVLLSLFTSFGYFTKKLDNLAMFTKFFDSIASGGVFWFDFMNAPQVEKTIPTKPYVKTMPSGRVFTEKIHKENGQIVKEIELQDSGDLAMPTKHYTERVWLLSRDEIIRTCLDLGFTLRHQFGDYLGGGWHKNSPRLILAFSK